jgi:bifunctional non-homologous end joining protein LigD
VEGESKAELSTPATEKESSGIIPQLLNEVKDASVYLADDNYLAQEKFDGERRLLRLENGEVNGINKKGQVVPVTKKIASSLKEECVIDGEIVGETVYAFDILSLKGEDLTELSCEERLDILNNLNLGKNIVVCETSFDTKSKKALYKSLKDRNAEGIVFKKKSSKYKAGRPNSGGSALKNKFYKTATVRVASHTKGKSSVGMEMKQGKKVVPVGKVTIPPNKDIPEVGSFIEVRYLYAYEGGSLFQPTYLGVRNDQDETDINLKQLIYKE